MGLSKFRRAFQRIGLFTKEHGPEIGCGCSDDFTACRAADFESFISESNNDDMVEQRHLFT